MSEDTQLYAKKKQTVMPPPGHGARTSHYQAFLLSIGFCAIFTAFSTAQNFATSRDKHVGSVTLGILYTTFTLTNIISSAIVTKVTAKVALLVGSLTYGAYVAANISFKAILMYPIGALMGMGAAILWTAQGVYITRCSQFYEAVMGKEAASTTGIFNGIFFSIFQMSQLIGNLLAAMLFYYNATDSFVFVVMTCICFGGSFILLFIKSLEPSSVAYTTVEVSSTPIEGKGQYQSLPGQIQQKSLTEKYIGPILLLRERKMQLLVPAILYSGLSSSFFFGEFPPMIDEKQWKFFAMAIFGASDSLTSFIFGRISDRWGRKPVLTIGYVAVIATVSFFLSYTIPQSDKAMFFSCAILLGIGDGCFNTQIYAILGVIYEKQSEDAFACFKFLQSASTAAAFFYVDVFSFDVKAIILLAFLVICLPLIYYLDSRVARIDKTKDDDGSFIQVQN